MRENVVMQLHEVGRPLFCGPAVLQALSGAPAAECCDVISEITRQDGPVRAVRCDVLVAAARRLGVDLRDEDVALSEKPTVAAWATRLEPGATAVIFTERPDDATVAHFLTVQKRDDSNVVIDNITTRPTALHESSWADGIVIRVWSASRCRSLSEIFARRMEKKRQWLERWSREDRALAEVLAAGDEL
jgi:hypothetical protein